MTAQPDARSVAVVTGSGSGIGATIAQRLAADGTHVVLTGRTREKLDQVAESIIAQGGAVTVAEGDVRDRDAVEAILDRVAEQFGTVDLLVNNAAGNFRARPEALSANGWRSVLDIVLQGSWNWTQAVGQRLITQQKPGAVVSIGSIGALTGSSSTVHSATAKAGVLAMTRSLAAAWGRHGIRLNVVTPGIIGNTGAWGALQPSGDPTAPLIAKVPLGRIGTRGEVADAVAFLLGDQAAYITGTNLHVDGGAALGTPWDPTEAPS